MGKKNGTAGYNEAEYDDFWRKCDGDGCGSDWDHYPFRPSVSMNPPPADPFRRPPEVEWRLRVHGWIPNSTYDEQ